MSLYGRIQLPSNQTQQVCDITHMQIHSQCLIRNYELTRKKRHVWKKWNRNRSRSLLGIAETTGLVLRSSWLEMHLYSWEREIGRAYCVCVNPAALHIKEHDSDQALAQRNCGEQQKLGLFSWIWIGMPYDTWGFCSHSGRISQQLITLFIFPAVILPAWPFCTHCFRRKCLPAMNSY